MMTDGEIDGFKILHYQSNTMFERNKKMPGSLTGNVCSVAFVKTEAMRAMGIIEGEPEKRWADYRGWLLGFQMRFVAMPFRQYGYGAIYSDNV